MKIIILGANGQLGHELSINLKNIGELIAFTKDELDITDFNVVEKALLDIEPNIVINAAAYTSVDKAEIYSNKVFNINSKAVENIARVLSRFSSYLIHYSTDYVFDGLKKEPYYEYDITSPINIYGRSKLMGEKKISSLMTNFYILRSSWIIGSHGNNFAKKFLKLAKDSRYLNVVNDQYGVPTSTSLISKTTMAIIESIIEKKALNPGIYHLTPKGKTTWYQIAQKISSIAKLNNYSLKLTKENIIPVSTKNYLTTAKRPLNSLLSTEKINNFLTFELPYWENDITETIQKIIEELKNEA
tara:strand:- start:41 stop:943 length:903 start_codon:yes stop_codon:yes gene_type:complete